MDECRAYLAGQRTLAQIRPALREMRENAAKTEGAVRQATACAVITTPTNSLGFLLYLAAARAYAQAGLEQKQEVYDAPAQRERARALVSLRAASAENEPTPAKIDWNC